MKKLVLLSILLLSTVNIFAQNDFKMSQRMTMAGRVMESTVMIKGARERTENSQSGMKNVTIMQCDLKRYIKINDIEKKYFIEPMVTAAAAEASVAPTTSTKVTKTKTTKGGVVTQTLEIIDTGERKQMFGLTARHIKTVMTVQPSPDACQKEASRIETDGWYVDLSPTMACKFDGPIETPVDHNSTPSGCIDRPNLIRKGSGKLGYALQLATKFSVPGVGEQDAETKAMMAKMGMGDGMMSMTTEVTELSRAALSADLFDIPVGYKQVNEMSDLFGRETQKSMGEYQKSPEGKKEMNQIMQGMPSGGPAAGAKKTGMIRVGVMSVTNSSGKQHSTDNYRPMLAMQIKSDKVEAVEISSVDEAKQLGCDYILNTDIKSLKQSTASKVGGLFGKVTGQGTGEGKVEATIAYDLMPLGSDGTRLQMQYTTAKIEGESNSILMALSNEAQAVVKALKK